ncbi:MAG: HEAT repeat domain-containing protein [Planctomycetales bacterium]
MTRYDRTLCLFLFAALPALVPTALQGDVIHLKSGGELRGELLPQPAANGRPPKTEPEQLTIRTLAGATVVVSRDDVEQVVRRRAVAEEHETLRRAAADTVDAHWELAEWCRQRGLLKERAVHLHRILELDPKHQLAHRGLGHVRHEGRWMTSEEMMLARGYVKHKGRFVLPQELELLQAEERESEAEKAWFKRIKMWRGWLDSDRVDRQARGRDELEGIRDADAVAALTRTFKNERREERRLLYVQVLSRIGGGRALEALAQQSLKDDSQSVREEAVRGARTIDRNGAVAIYLRGLKSEMNPIVNRAAAALGDLGDDAIVPLLIEALVTRHRYKVQVPDQNITFGADGSMPANGASLPPDVQALLASGQVAGYSTGGNPVPVRMKTITVQKDEQNEAVLSALNTLTGEDFGYQEQKWRDWYKARQAGPVPPPKKNRSSKTK